MVVYNVKKIVKVFLLFMQLLTTDDRFRAEYGSLYRDKEKAGISPGFRLLVEVEWCLLDVL